MAVMTLKTFECSKCGCVTKQMTNHNEGTCSWGLVNCCPDCPPHAKYSEFGGSTTWIRKEEEG